VDTDITLTEAELDVLRRGRLLTLRDDAVFRLEGPGVTDCLQGLLTNDVRVAGDRGLLWGALLTPKGMIITDAWVRREGPTAATVIVPAIARAQVRELFQKILPPRLAKSTDQTGVVTIGWLLGQAPDAAPELVVARPHGPAPFAAMLLSHDPRADVRRIELMGWQEVPTRYGEAAKLIAGWPTLGREIDERTMIQEVRFDELEGVRYDKGCYTGQETVARLHFRGHSNRLLRGITWRDETELSGRDVTVAGKKVGTITTSGKFGPRMLALAVLRREVAVGEVVDIGETKATVTALPFVLEPPQVA
jgi:folate-binding protein YgfZ